MVVVEVVVDGTDGDGCGDDDDDVMPFTAGHELSCFRAVVFQFLVSFISSSSFGLISAFPLT